MLRLGIYLLRLSLTLVAAAGLVRQAAPQLSPPWHAAVPSCRTWLLADVDGDNRPELAAGYGTIVELRLSSRTGGARFVLPGSPEQLPFTVVDVDSDQDRDLIISDPGLGYSAVWINRGRGDFVRDERWTLAQRIPAVPRRTLDEPAGATDLYSTDPNEDPPVDRALAPEPSSPLATGDWDPRDPARSPADRLRLRVTARGPPLV